MPPEDRPEDRKLIREPISSAKQKRLDAMLEAAQQKASGEKPDFEYATKLLTDCVLGNPSNIFYVKGYIETLKKKYNNNKTGKTLAKFQELGARMAQKKAIDQEKWDEALKQGLRVLTANPWDKTALLNMAKVSSKYPSDFEVELYYLRTALEPSPKDPDINKLCAIALAAIGEVDQAITCWHRVEVARQGTAAEEEAKRHIAYLNTHRMDMKDGTASQGFRPGRPGEVEELLTPEKRLLRKISQHPEKLEPYVELSQMYINEERYGDAEKILAKAVEQSDGNLDIREKWEDARLRNIRQKITKIEDPAEKKKQEKLLFAQELEVCKSRCERYPNNPLFRYDLGYHYMIVRQYNDAIRELQMARNDPRKKGSCLLALGQCFQQIEQYPLAMDHYEMAIEEIPDRDAKNKKKALYSAGKLSLWLGDLEKADKHLKVLAGLDFTYKDVPALLDKLAKKRKNGSPESGAGPAEPTK
jgi:tetratricopeptide (TPR) repeat protein